MSGANSASAGFPDFASPNFDPGKYVNEISAKCIGGAELNSQRNKIQTLAEETHVALKKNVFQHYEQFIDTAKDISYLAGEMYQISQMLRDQRSLMQSILDTSLIGPRKNNHVLGSSTSTTSVLSPIETKANEDEERKKILGVLEKVEGAGEIIEHTNRRLIFEGDLLEIDPDNYSAVQRKRGYLFNDGIMIAVWVTNRRGPQRYKFQAFYELGSVGLVVNIRDPECPKHTFKLLIFPSVHLLQCPNQQEKDSWVNHIESIQKVIRNPTQKTLPGQKSLDTPTQESLPGFSSLDSERPGSPEDSISLEPLPDWVLDIPEDLDVWVAQRNFNEAVDLYESYKEFLDSLPISTKSNRPDIKDIKQKVDSRIKGLIEIIVQDLEIITPEKILQGGPRSIRKSVDLLIRLGRENQALQLFLAHRSAYIKQKLKRVKTEGRSQIYLIQLCELFFNNVVETMKEFRRSFSDGTSGNSCLVVWTNHEVSTFVNSFCRQLFSISSSSHLSVICKSVSKLRSESQKVFEQGLDVACIVDSTLTPHIERAITDSKDKLIEAIRHRYRSQDEACLPMKFVDRTSLNKTINEMISLGVTQLSNYVHEDNFSLSISSNTLAFSKSWLHFCQDVTEILAPEWQRLIQAGICEVILFELPHLEHAISRARKKKDPRLSKMMEEDLEFVLDHVCPAASKIYEKSVGSKCVQLVRIIEENNKDRERKAAFSPGGKPTAKTRFTTPEFV